MTEETRHWLELEDEVCVVTGAAGGIGEGIVRELVAAGARVALLDRDGEGVRRLAAEIDSSSSRTVADSCDVTDVTSVEDAARVVANTLGAVGVLVNNAGIIRHGDLDSISIEDWQAQLDVNLNGYLRCAQAFGRAMLERNKGAIVHVASIAAGHPQVRGGAYAPGKAAITMLSRQLAIEWGPRGVRSNTVSPGLVRTPMTEAFYSAPGAVERREAMVPIRRIGATQDIARAVAFLASPKASYVNGADLLVDGGITQTLMSHIPRADH